MSQRLEQPEAHQNRDVIGLESPSPRWERSFLLNGHYGDASTMRDSMKLNGGDGREAGTGAYQKYAQGEGVVYTVAGCAGQATGGPLNHPAHYRSLNELGTMVIDVTSNRLDAIFLSATGEARDQFTLLKTVPVNLPAAPRNLVALPASANGVGLFWSDLATNELGYIVQRSTDGTNFATVLHLESNAVSAADIGRLSGITYYYRVAATNAEAVSEFSNIASATTGAPAGVPRAPGELVSSSCTQFLACRSPSWKPYFGANHKCRKYSRMRRRFRPPPPALFYYRGRTRPLLG